MKIFGFTKNRKTGLALGGGAVLGAVHAGVLRALEEKKVRIDCISGTSIGSFIGALYAFGVKVDEIEKITRNVKWLDISEISLSKYGLLSNEKFGELLVKHVGDKKIEESEIPLRIIATDISSGEKVILQKGSLAEAVRASTCIPGIFKPVEVDGRLLVDGGIVENVPVTPIKEMGADKIIAVQLLAHQAARKPDHIIEVLLNTFEFMISNISKPHLKNVDLLIKPDLTGFDKVDTDQVSDLIEIGYKTTIEMMN